MKRIILFILIFAANHIVYADSFIWKVESGDKYLYLGGTVHVLRESDYPMPEEFNQAFEKSDILVLEVDPDKLSPAETAEYIRAHGSYSDEKSLKTVLSPEAYKAFRDYCRENEISVMGLGKLKPAIIMTTLMAQKFQKIQMAKGVDFYYFEKSKRAGKKIRGLETHEFQLNMIVSMGEGHESEFMLKTIREMDTFEERLDGLIGAWKSGDAEKLYNFEVSAMEKDDPGLYEDLILKRNINWLPEIENYLKTDETELILVGGAHIVGPKGLLEELKKKGYKISKVEIDKGRPLE